jgi:hypothetical protein
MTDAIRRIRIAGEGIRRSQGQVAVLNDQYVLVDVGNESNRRFVLQQRLLGALPYWVFLP